MMTLATPVGAAPPPAQPQQPSPFVQCDGMKGHVGTGELIGQLLAITVTAGLAGDAINAGGDVNKRLDGRAGVDACERAIVAESDPTRRAQLGLARTIHLLEANDLPAALTSARDTQALASAMMQDWAFARSVGFSIAYLEANVLTRMGRFVDAEAAALRAVAAARYEMFAMTGAISYLRLTPSMTAEKASVFDQYVRIRPQYLLVRAEMRAAGGDWRGAAQDVADQNAVYRGFFPEIDQPVLAALGAIYALNAGDMTSARRDAGIARAVIDKAIAKGAGRDSVVVEADEVLAFYGVAELAESGKLSEAASAFAARPRWLSVPPPAQAALLARLRAGLPASSLVGPLAQTPQSIAVAALAQNRAALIEQDAVGSLYNRTRHVVRRSDYGGAGAVWKVGAKPRFLLKPNPKDPPPYEIIDTSSRFFGLAAGEAALLHAALIARQRGKQGFVIIPNRKVLTLLEFRIGNPGEDGIPATALLDAATVIAALSPAMPQPVAR